ncbi:MAG: hydrogenase small subunit [SAR324 cluster bacterium]|nr:hydrogenase small subunit [SAR324 cluster bacterium]
MGENITRREALRKIYEALVVIGASAFISFEDLLAADNTVAEKPMVVWLHGTSCSGCSTAFLNIEDVPVVDLITKFVSLVFHPDLSSATGHQFIEILDQLTQSGKGYILVFEGGIPVKMPHTCMIADKPLTYWVERLAAKATACIGAGTCATLGGIASMDPVTGNIPLDRFLEQRNISKPIVNIPSCPMKPEHITYTILHLLKKGSLPELDKHFRPKKFFARTIHERCLYYADYQEGHFAEFIGDSGCLFKIGCQGPVTRNDCIIMGYNGNTNTCIKAGHPCIGCAGEKFPRQIMFHRFDDPRVIKNKF